MLHSLHRRAWLGLELGACACLLTSSHVLAQDTKTVKTTSGSALSFRTFKEIPAATEPCTPEECEWWNRLRQAGGKLQQKSDEKSKRAYALLFLEGIEKSYRIPLKDRPSQVLFTGPPVQSADLPAGQRNGIVRLSVEHRADGSVGEVKVVKGLGPQIDRRCILAAQGVIFLPAVRDGIFVTEWQTPKYEFFHRF